MRSYIVIAILFFVQLAHAGGDKVGNGGNLVICKNPDGALKSATLLDYYEAEVNGQTLRLNPMLPTWKEKLTTLFKEWQSIAPKRTSVYQNWLETFTADAAFYPNIKIPDTNDSGSVFIPIGCELSAVAFQRPDEEVLPGGKRYIISKNLWDLLDETQRAGLVLHELIYREAITSEHQTSFATRHMNAFLSSSLPTAQSYLAVLARMNFEYVEFGGAILSGRPPHLRLDQHGRITDATITELYSRNVSIGGFHATFGDRKPSDPPVTIELDSYGRVRTFRSALTVVNLTKFEAQLSSNIFGEPETPFELKIQCQSDGKENCDLYVANGSVISSSSRSSVVYKSTKGQLVIYPARQGVINLIRPNGDFMLTNGSTDLMLTDPASTYLKIDSGEIIKNISRIDAVNGLEQRFPSSYTRLWVPGGVWVRKSKDWVFQPDR